MLCVLYPQSCVWYFVPDPLCKAPEPTGVRITEYSNKRFSHWVSVATEAAETVGLNQKKWFELFLTE